MGLQPLLQISPGVRRPAFVAAFDGLCMDSLHTRLKSNECPQNKPFGCFEK